MKIIWAFILLAFLSDDINRIAAVNRLKKEAEQAYKSSNFTEAVEKYKVLIDSLGQGDDRLKLNLSNAYYKLNDTTQALNLYEQLTDADNNGIRSIAQQQLGIMANNQGKYKQSLEHFKNAMRADPGNEDARYNYELLKKFMEQQQQNQQNQKNQQNDQQQKQKNQQNQQDQQQQEQQKQEQQKNEEREGDNQEQKDQQQKAEEQQQQAQDKESEDQKEKDMQSRPEDMKDMKISREMAKMILEAMRNNEIQYLQQMKKKAKNQPDSGKPDW